MHRKRHLIFLSEDLRITEEFAHEFGLTPQESAAIQGLVSQTATRIGELSKKNARIRTITTRSIVIEVEPFFQGAELLDPFIEGMKAILGARFEQFTQHYGEQYENALEHFGAERRSITIFRINPGEILYVESEEYVVEQSPVLSQTEGVFSDLPALRQRLGALLDLVPASF